MATEKPVRFGRAYQPQTKMEREAGLEPVTSSLARRRSTTELLPLDCLKKLVGEERFELSRIAPHDPKSCSSTSSDTRPLHNLEKW